MNGHWLILTDGVALATILCSMGFLYIVVMTYLNKIEDSDTVKEELCRLEELIKKAKINSITTGIEAARKERHDKDN